MPCTMLGSASVDVSPSSSSFLTAILRRMRRMILPDLVLGRPERQQTHRVSAPAQRYPHLALRSSWTRCMLVQQLQSLDLFDLISPETLLSTQQSLRQQQGFYT